MRKFFIVVLCTFFLMLSFPCTLSAEDDPCDIDEESEECIISKASKSRNTINELYKQIEAASSSLKDAQALASSYATKAESLSAEIAELTTQIDELVVKIDELIVRIEYNQNLVDELNNRVLSRMEAAQGTMHFNEFLDFILGSESFADLLRRAYGISAINSKEKADRELLIDTINQLEKDKSELDTAKAELDVKKDELVDKQAEYLVMQSYYEEVAQETYSQIEDYRNAIEDETKNYNYLKSMVSSEALASLPSSAGFTSPVPGASISAGVWYYPKSFGGGVHLGVDYAVKLGQTIYAPANGIIIVSDDNCPTYGYLGNSCGGAGGGVSYGGNQIYMLCSANGSVYAITFSHLQSGSLVSTGVVMQGDAIARVGSSGNSTGPHCHIELYYLGEGDMEDIYDDYLNRNYSSSFNCGWGAYALQNTCDNKGSAPCRLDGSKYFGS